MSTHVQGALRGWPPLRLAEMEAAPFVQGAFASFYHPCPFGRCLFCGTFPRSPGVAASDHSVLRNKAHTVLAEDLLGRSFYHYYPCVWQLKRTKGHEMPENVKSKKKGLKKPNLSLMISLFILKGSLTNIFYSFT
jgi:hypothetical protein